MVGFLKFVEDLIHSSIRKVQSWSISSVTGICLQKMRPWECRQPDDTPGCLVILLECALCPGKLATWDHLSSNAHYKKHWWSQSDLPISKDALEGLTDTSPYSKLPSIQALLTVTLLTVPTVLRPSALLSLCLTCIATALALWVLLDPTRSAVFLRIRPLSRFSIVAMGTHPHFTTSIRSPCVTSLILAWLIAWSALLLTRALL